MLRPLVYGSESGQPGQAGVTGYPADVSPYAAITGLDQRMAAVSPLAPDTISRLVSGPDEPGGAEKGYGMGGWR